MADDLLSTLQNIRNSSGEGPFGASGDGSTGGQDSSTAAGPSQPQLHPLVAAAMVGGAQVASDAAAKRAADEEAQTTSNLSITFHPGRGTATIKDMPMTDIQKAGEESTVDPIARVHKILQQYGLRSQSDPAPSEVSGGGLGTTYRASREYGNDPVGAGIDAVLTKAHLMNPANNAKQIARQDLEDYQKFVAPVAMGNIAMAREQNTERRTEQAHEISLNKEFESETSAENIVKHPSAEAAVQHVKQVMGSAWTPGMQPTVEQAYDQAQQKRAGSLVQARRAAFKEITPESVGYAPDADSYINSIEDPANPFTPGDRAYAKRLFAGAQQAWNEARGQKKLQLAQEAARIQLENQKIAQNDLLLKASSFLQDPATKDKFLDTVASDGNAIYNPSVQKNPYTKSALEGAVIARFGRVPNKVSEQEDQQLQAAKFTNKIADNVAAIFDKWQKRGTPITGAMVGRFDEKTAQFGSTNMLAMRGVKASDRAEMGQDIAFIRNQLVGMATNEAKVGTGGNRTPAQIIQMYKEVSPNLFSDAPLNAGAIQGVRSQAVTRANLIYQKQWGPDAPVRMLDDGRTAIWDPKQQNPKTKQLGAWVVVGSR